MARVRVSCVMAWTYFISRSARSACLRTSGSGKPANAANGELAQNIDSRNVECVVRGEKNENWLSSWRYSAGRLGTSKRLQDPAGNKPPPPI